jgi:hypothetical protein
VSLIGGFAGLSSNGGIFKRNYATGTIEINNSGSTGSGGFIGQVLSQGKLFTLVDNFSTGTYHDTVGLYGTWPDYFGGFVGLMLNKTPTDAFENNHFYNAIVSTCSGKASTVKPACTSAANANVFNDASHAVYTRADNSWDFVNTWRAVNGGLPVLR